MKSFAKNILLVTLPTFLIIFLFAEIFIRLHNSHINLDELTGKKESINPMFEWANNDSFSSFSAKPGKYSDGKTVNSHGFISTPEIELGKTSNRIRLVFLGESSTAGTGTNLKDEETWPWKMVEILREKTGRDIDFINASLGGYTTFESYGRLWSRIRFYNPDIIVVNHGWNEMYYFNDTISERPILWGKGFSVENKISIEIIQPNWIDPFVKWSQVLSRVRLILTHTKSVGEVGGKSNKSTELENHFNKKGLIIFKENMNLIAYFAQKYNCSLFVCKQPTLITNFTTEEDKKRCRCDFHGFNHQAHIEAFDSIYSIIQVQFPSQSIIDLTSISGISDCFYDHIHPTELGTSKIAEIVADSLINNYFNNIK